MRLLAPLWLGAVKTEDPAQATEGGEVSTLARTYTQSGTIWLILGRQGKPVNKAKERRKSGSGRGLCSFFLCPLFLDKKGGAVAFFVALSVSEQVHLPVVIRHSS